QSPNQAEAASGCIRELAKNDTPEHGADVPQDHDVGSNRHAGVMLRLQEVRIKILGAVRKEHHESHQQKEIEAQLPLLANSAQERTRGGRAMVPPGLRLSHLGADVEREQSGYSAEPKHRPPAPCGEGEAVGNRSEQIAHRVSILQDTAKDASPAA